MLTNAQTERLDLLIEEAAEIIHAASKIKRFGFEGSNPFNRDAHSNRSHLEIEIGGLCAVLDLLTEAGEIEEDHCSSAQAIKAQEFKHGIFTKYQGE